VEKSFIERLACPKDRAKLALRGEDLVCESGHPFRVIDGIPVLLRDDVKQTLWVADATLRAIQSSNSGLFLETLGVTEEERQSYEAASRVSSVDPVVQILVAATCGMLYRGVRGRLRTYPIPHCRLENGAGRAFLDIGCSWGRWSIAAAQNGFRVIGIDPSLGALVTAKRVATQLGVEVQFVCADARFLPIADESIDVAFSYSVLQHFDKADARLAMTECRRILRRGGQAVVQMPNKFGIRSLYHRARKAFTRPENFDVRYWSPSEMRRVFTETIGDSRLEVDGFFGLGIQLSDVNLLPKLYRPIVYTSDILRHVTNYVPPLSKLADSLYVYATK